MLVWVPVLVLVCGRAWLEVVVWGLSEVMVMVWGKRLTMPERKLVRV